jgi:hypothetical protein
MLTKTNDGTKEVGFMAMTPMASASVGALRSTEVHFTRSRGPGSWTPWFRNSGQGQKRFCMHRGPWVTSAPDPDFWNPKVRVPMCVNAAAGR